MNARPSAAPIPPPEVSAIPPATVHPAELGFDFDGVLADTAEAFLRLACEEYGMCGFTLDDITEFAVEECLAMDERLVREIFHRILVDSVGVGLKPMPGALEVLQELARRAPITVVTARPLEAPVHQWLDAHLDPRTRRAVRLVAMGDHDGKAGPIRALGLRYFIDDRAATCRQLAAQGLGGIVFDQPWNRRDRHLPRVTSWREIARMCLPTSKGSGGS